MHDSQPETNSEALVGEASTLVRNIGAPYWKTSDGRTFPRVAGAEDPPGDTDTESPTEGEKEFDKDRALATIRTQREKELKLEAELKELRGLKSRLKTLEDEKRERDDADKSEADRLKSQLATAEQKYIDAARELQDTRIRQSIERAAAKAGAADPDDVYRLLDPSALEINDEGRLVNAEKLVADLLKAKPYLAAATETTATAPRGNAAGPRPAGQQTIAQAGEELFKRMRESTPTSRW